MNTGTLRKSNLQLKLYHMAPHFVKRIAVNIEAWKRDRFRRFGNYKEVLNFYAPSWYRNDIKVQEEYQVKRLKSILQTARTYVPYYQKSLVNINFDKLGDLKNIPLLEKDAIRNNPCDFVAHGLSKKNLWLGSTSGSTGSPLFYSRDRNAIRANQAVEDSLMEYYGCTYGEKRIRISGVYVAPYKQKSPPFWIYVDRYRQLQCSAYHLGPKTYSFYLKAMKEAGGRYGTGHANAWHLLASYIINTGVNPPNFKAIFTDSEGLSREQQDSVEFAFNCPVYQTYGLSEVGQVAIQCTNKHYHILTKSSIVEIINDNNEPVAPGETGHIIVTDLTSGDTPFIRYKTRDLATLSLKKCTCGWQSPSLTEIVGRVNDRIITPEGRWIGLGLGYITKLGIGITESQILQKEIDKILIKVVPDKKFEPSSMNKVIDEAHKILGNSITFTWELVDHIERSPAGKLRHVVCELDEETLGKYR